MLKTVVLAGLLFAPLALTDAYAHPFQCDNYCIHNGTGLDYLGNIRVIIVSFGAVSVLIVFVLMKNTGPKISGNLTQ